MAETLEETDMEVFWGRAGKKHVSGGDEERSFLSFLFDDKKLSWSPGQTFRLLESFSDVMIVAG